MTDTAPASTQGQFRKYDHLERMGHPEVADIDIGDIYVFPKLDGTNASVWVDAEGHVQCGSRRRVLSADADNHGFHAWVHSDDPKALAVRMLVQSAPEIVLYGEWLVPHTLKTYREDAWRRFWVFDVWNHTKGAYMPYAEYGEHFEGMGLDVIHPLCTAENPSANQNRSARPGPPASIRINDMLERNKFLVQDGLGSGEGVVLKNYLWRNRFGRQPWAKVVRNEFKERNGVEFGPPKIKGERDIAAEVVNELATEDFIRKEWAKVANAVAEDQKTLLVSDDYTGGMDSVGQYESVVRQSEFVAVNRGKIIPRFLGTIYHTFMVEEVWTIAKKWKNPVLDFSRVNKLLTIRAKAVLAEVF